MAKRTVDILIRGRDATAQGFRSAAKGLNRLASKVLSFRNIIAGGIGFALIGRELGKTLDAFAKQESAVKSMSDALDLLGKGGKDAVRDMTSFAASIQKVTTIGDETVLELAALGASLGRLSGKALKDATRAAIGLSKRLKVDTVAAMRLVSRAAIGDTSTLTRYGIKLSETLSPQEKFNELLRLGAESFSLATGEVDTYAGRLKQLQNNFGDLREEMGASLIPLMMSLMKEAIPIIEGLRAATGGLADAQVDLTRQTGGLTAATKKLQEETRQTLRDLVELRGKASLSPEDEQRISAITADLKGQGIAVAKMWDDAAGSVDNFRKALEQALGAREQRAGLKNIEKDLKGVQTELARWLKVQKQAQDDLKAATTGFFVSGTDAIAAERGLKKVAPLIDILRKKIAELTAEREKLAKVTGPSLVPIPKVRPPEQIEAETKAQKQFKTAAEAAAKAAANEAKSYSEGVFAQTRTDTEKFMAEMDKLTEARKLGKVGEAMSLFGISPGLGLDEETFKRATEQLIKERDKIKDAARDLAKESAQAIFDAVRTPLEEFELRVKELQKRRAERDIAPDLGIDEETFQRALKVARERRDAAVATDMRADTGGPRGAGAALEARFLTRQPGTRMPAEHTAKNTAELVKQGKKQDDVMRDILRALGPEAAIRAQMNINVLRF